MKLRRIPAAVAAAAVLIVLTTFVSFAAETYSSIWAQDASGIWHAYQSIGNSRRLIKGAWLCDDAVTGNDKNVWYLIDGNGNLVSAGLVRDGSGNYYSLETNHTGYYGMLRYQSGDYECGSQIVHLELEDTHNGSFAAIRNEDAIERLKSIYGLFEVPQISNKNVLYSSEWVKSPLSLPAYERMDQIYNNLGGFSLSNAKRTAMTEVVSLFMTQYITADMTDFDKEMMIIRWMVENIDYDIANSLNGTIPNDSHTAYGALVNKRAACDGYMSAFEVLGKACGLNVISVRDYVDIHAWNMINLDGDWYHVDVTWEDPTPSNNYGFKKLWNRYINLTDQEVRALRDHSTWDGAGDAKAESVKYGHQAVAEWMRKHV